MHIHPGRRDSHQKHWDQNLNYESPRDANLAGTRDPTAPLRNRAGLGRRPIRVDNRQKHSRRQSILITNATKEIQQGFVVPLTLNCQSEEPSHTVEHMMVSLPELTKGTCCLPTHERLAKQVAQSHQKLSDRVTDGGIISPIPQQPSSL